jgi:hypothetical protein
MLFQKIKANKADCEDLWCASYQNPECPWHWFKSQRRSWLLHPVHPIFIIVNYVCQWCATGTWGWFGTSCSYKLIKALQEEQWIQLGTARVFSDARSSLIKNSSGLKSVLCSIWDCVWPDLF